MTIPPFVIDSAVGPAVDPIEALQAVIKFQRLAKCATPQPLAHHHLSLVRMNEAETADTHHVFNGCTREIEKSFIRVLLALGAGDNNHSGNAVDQLAKFTFALTHRFFRSPSLIDVRLQNAPTDDASIRVAHREPLHAEPPVDAIGAPLTEFNIVRLAAF